MHEHSKNTEAVVINPKPSTTMSLIAPVFLWDAELHVLISVLITLSNGGLLCLTCDWIDLKCLSCHVSQSSGEILEQRKQCFLSLVKGVKMFVSVAIVCRVCWMTRALNAC